MARIKSAVRNLASDFQFERKMNCSFILCANFQVEMLLDNFRIGGKTNWRRVHERK